MNRLTLAAAFMFLLAACRKNDGTIPAVPADAMTPEASRLIVDIEDTTVEATNLNLKYGITAYHWCWEPSPNMCCLYGDIEYSGKSYHIGVVFEPPQKWVGACYVEIMYLINHADSSDLTAYHPQMEITKDDRKDAHGTFSGAMVRTVPIVDVSPLGIKHSYILDSSLVIKNARFRMRWTR